MVYDTKWLNTLSKPIFDYKDPNFGLEKSFFKKTQCKPLIVPSSYVFHYKQVTVNRNDWAKHHFRLFDFTKNQSIIFSSLPNAKDVKKVRKSCPNEFVVLSCDPTGI